MAEKKYKLTGSGSVAYTDEDGVLHRYSKSDKPITAAELKKFPERQQKFFEEVGKEEEPEETKPEDMTVEELKKALDEAGKEYGDKAKKADLIKLYKAV